MRYLLAIDDTDRENWPGTGHLLEKIRNDIEKKQWGTTDRITRHQLLVHPSIPYTSHNSVMCFSGVITERETVNSIIDLAISYIKKEAAPESDPGLCVVFPDKLSIPEQLISFGQRAKREKIGKEEAYALAELERLSIYLSEQGGTGEGVIGALAGVGLRLSGNDGRFRGSHFLVEKMTKYKVSDLYQMGEGKIDEVCTEHGVTLSGEEYVFLEGKIKTILKDNKSVLPVKEVKERDWCFWKNLSANEIKRY